MNGKSKMYECIWQHLTCSSEYLLYASASIIIDYSLSLCMAVHNLWQACQCRVRFQPVPDNVYSTICRGNMTAHMQARQLGYNPACAIHGREGHQGWRGALHGL